VRTNKILTGGILLLLLGYYALFLAHPINLVTADLGRHLKNGEELLKSHHLVENNFYSYTYPDFPTTNHHWGSGALFYLVWKAAGFAGLQAFFIALSLASFGLFFWLAKKYGGILTATLLSLIAIPLLSERTEVRPEVLTYLFSGLFLWILYKFRDNQLSARWLWVLPVIEVLWVNSHIYFFMGFAITGAFMLEALLLRHREQLRKLSIIFIALAAATLVNPFFLKGAVAPFAIFQNYGYRLVENSSVWFLEKIIYIPNILIFKILFSILILSFALVLLKNRKNLSLVNLFLAAGVSIMGWFMLRNFVLFALFALPIASMNFAPRLTSPTSLPLVGRVREGGGKKEWLALGLTALVFFLALSGELRAIFPTLPSHYSLGLDPETAKAAEFFESKNISGPIFNNYDIGGYLIFYLYPRNQVFVDNRPEAYPADFFQNTYIPIQEDDTRWHEEARKNGFNAIFFSHRDVTPWGQTFLKNRLEDPDWAVAYLDEYSIIFVGRDSVNSGIIESKTNK